MAFHLRQMLPPHLISLLWLLCAVLSSATVLPQNETVLPGCPSTCGNFTVPYPFGTGKGCYKEGFEILCKNSTPYLGVTGSEIKSLSLEKVRIHGPSAFGCYDPRSGAGRAAKRNQIDLCQTPFTFSNTHNKLIAAGCDIFSYISDGNTDKYTSGCASLCSRTINVDLLNSSCVGVGCCQSIIPMGLKTYNLSVDSINTQSRSWDSDMNGCSFAALHDGDPNQLFGLNDPVSRYFNHTSYIPKDYNHTSYIPIATLDWAIGGSDDSCADNSIIEGNNLKIEWNRSKIECAYKGECVNSTTGYGYRCRCLKGYQGNPYLLHGCKDINECKGSNQCKKRATCFNTNGSYFCSCPYGYYGDGRKGGLGCLLLDFPVDSRSIKMEVAFIGIGVGVGLLFLLAIGFWLYKKLKARKQIKLKEKFFKKNGGLLLEQQITSRDGSVEKTKIFVTEELERATDNYNESRILGRGGSGTVYKGMLTDGRIVAIKRSKIVDESQTGQFINELVILSQINHKHVVKLLGCCLETEVPLLVYEYISNGTLSHHLHDENCGSPISWEHRLRISIEIAGALSYLHSSTSTPIFHRDIKSCNILLDENYRAIVSDFGISRSVPYEKTHLTTLVQGTFGYLDPEYFHSGQFTEKSDVYSFGIVIVELLTGQKPISFTRSEEEKNLAMHFISSIKQGKLYQILETLVLNEAGKEEVFAIAKLAKRCLKLMGKKRPTMKEVITELEVLRKNQEKSLKQQKYPETTNLVDEKPSLSMTGPQSG